VTCSDFFNGDLDLADWGVRPGGFYYDAIYFNDAPPYRYGYRGERDDISKPCYDVDADKVADLFTLVKRRAEFYASVLRVLPDD